MNTLRLPLLALALLLGSGCHSCWSPKAKPITTSIPSADAINPYGSIHLALPNTLFHDSTIRHGDLVRVTVYTNSLDLPVLPSYRLVGPGEDVLVDAPKPNTPLLLATFYGSFAERHGLAEPSVPYPLPVTITLLKRNAYAANLSLLSAIRTTNRTDYAALSDADYANFRPVRAPALRPATLYRSSSPIQPKLGRHLYADAACRAAGIRSIINMSDSAPKARSTEGFSSTYVSTQPTLFLPMGVDFFAPAFQTHLATCIRFLSTNTPPALLHCIEGQDRTGFACALIGAYFGASYRDLEDDYLTTFRNYYGATLTPQAEQALRSTFSRLLSRALALPEPLPQSLQAPVRSYFLSIGLTPAELSAFESTFRNPPSSEAPTRPTVPKH